MSVVYAKSLNDDVELGIRKFLEKVERHLNIRDGYSICIKPNLCLMKKSNTGVTTDPKVISAIIDFLMERWNVKVNIVESHGNINNIDITFRALGFEKFASMKGVKLVNLSQEEKANTRIDGYFLKSIKLPKILLNCDFLVSVAKLKTHSFTTISCVLKNQFGCIPGGKARFHPVLSEVIADINSVLKPDFSLVDGLVALDGPGPIYGKPVPLKIMIAGNDPVAVDCVSAKSMGFDPAKIKHIALSSKAGVGSTQFELDGTIPQMKFKCNSTLNRLTTLFLSFTGR